MKNWKNASGNWRNSQKAAGTANRNPGCLASSSDGKRTNAGRCLFITPFTVHPDDVSGITINTIEDVVYMGLNRYGRKLLPLPLPKLIVFYNGTDEK